MASFFTWWLLENWVSKTRFINQKNLKKSKSQAQPQPHRIGSDQREKESDQREGDQIREGEKELAWPASHGPGRAACVARPGARVARLARPRARAARLARFGLAQPGSRGLRFATGSDFFWVFPSSSSFYFFIFLSFWLWFHFCWCCCFVIYSLINRVFKTWFSSSRHVEYDATSDVNRPWKSILLYSNC